MKWKDKDTALKQELVVYRAKLNHEKGNFSTALRWLRTHIHEHGKTHTASALVKKVTGRPLESSFFTKYLEEKYKDIYKV